MTFSITPPTNTRLISTTTVTVPGVPPGYTYTIGGNTLNPPIYGNMTVAGDTAGKSFPSITTAGDVDIKGDIKMGGDLLMKGKKLSDILDNIEKRLAILHPNPELEDRWENLKQLGEQYKALEAELIEKEKIWAILKR